MRFMVIVKASPESERGGMGDPQEFKAMGDFNDELVKAGVMLAAEGLLPSAKGVRIEYDGAKRRVVDGPFAEAKELVAGFWLIETKSRDEAVEWLKRAPFKEGQVEIRQIAEAEDFGEAYTPELKAQEERQRAQLERNKRNKAAEARH